jgi:hypothetical protein
MPAKTVPLSVRVTDADAAFLAGLEIAGATTPSEKLRAILAAERSRVEGAEDPVQAFEVIRDMLRPAQRRTRRAEAELACSSDFVRKLYDRLPELVAVAFAGPGDRVDQKRLAAFEARLLDQVFALAQEVLELALVERSRCYDPQAIAVRLGPVEELIALIRMSQERRKETTDG